MEQIKLKKLLNMVICLLIVISTLFSIYKFNKKYISDEKYISYQVMVIEKIKEEENILSYIVKLNNDKFILNIYASKYGKQKIKLTNYSDYKYGDILEVKGKIVIPELLNNPYEFDYKRYLNSTNIYGVINTYSSLTYKGNNGNKLIKKTYIFRDHICNIIEKNCIKDNADVLKGVIYGDKKQLNQDIKQSFSNIGLSHMLVASGTNIAIVIAVIGSVCKKLKMNKKTINILLIISILIFVMLCNFEISITRAGIMAITTLILNLKNKKTSSYKKLFIAFLLLYILNPMCIYSISFQLSFLATFSIILFYKKIYLTLDYNIKYLLNKKLYCLLKHPLKLLSIMLSVQIGILPIQINTFNNYPIISIVSNICIGLIISFIQMMGVIGICFCIMPQISGIIFKLLNPVITIILKIVKILNSISILISFESLHCSIIIAYYIYIALIFLNNNLIIKKYHLSILFNKIINKLKKIVIILIFVLIIISRIYNIFWNNYIIFFNVGQGETSLISYKGKHIVIDIGSTSDKLSQNILLNYLKKRNISKLDLVIISHFDLDHVNGVIEILNNIQVTNIIYAIPLEENKIYNDIIKNIESKNINQIIVESGDIFSFNNIQIEILYPGKRRIKNDANSNSIVCIIKINKKRILYTGDATIETEKELLNSNVIKKIDILKVGHHGSKSSTSERFIQKLKPQIAVISSKKKVFGHPSEIVLQVLEKYNVDIYITEQKGAIKIII